MSNNEERIPEKEKLRNASNYPAWRTKLNAVAYDAEAIDILNGEEKRPTGQGPVLSATIKAEQKVWDKANSKLWKFIVNSIHHRDCGPGTKWYEKGTKRQEKGTRWYVQTVGTPVVFGYVTFRTPTYPFVPFVKGHVRVRTFGYEKGTKRVRKSRTLS